MIPFCRYVRIGASGGCSSAPAPTPTPAPTPAPTPPPVGFYGWTDTNGAGGASILNDGDTYQFVIPGVGDSGYCRTGVALAGKVYCEFEVTQRGGLLPHAFGVTKAPPIALFTPGNGNGNMFSGNGGCGLPAQGAFNNGGAVASATVFGQGDVIGAAFDADTGNLWLSKNGVYTTGDPATDTAPLMTLAAGVYYFYCAQYSCLIAAGTYTADIKPSALSQSYGPPVGYSPYEPG